MNDSIFFYFYNLSQFEFIERLSYFISYPIFYFLIFAVFVWAIFFSKNKMFNFAIIFSALLIAYILVEFLKNIFGVARPFVSFNLTPILFESSYSFPSLHTTIIFTLAFVMFNLHKRIGVFLIFLALLVALSRIILGMHYPLDVLAGVLVASLVSYFIIKIFNKVK